MKYVGAIEKLQFDMSKTLQEPLDLINYIDAAQVRGWRTMGGSQESVPHHSCWISQRRGRKYSAPFSQQDGKLPFVPGDEEMILGVSKYGVKVASLDQCVSRK